MQPISHSDHVLQQLCSQLEYGFLCDCSIAVGDVHFRAHRVVLAACSSYFHKLFVNQPAESSQLWLSSQAVSPDHFDLILQLMYTGRLESSPADPERFRASLNFLKLYNAACFPVAAERGREKEEGDPLAPGSGGSNPLVFGVQLYQDKNTGQEAPQTSQHRPVSVKAEAPDNEGEPQTFLCHHCGLAFEEQRRLRDHLELHAQRPFHCPICGLAFERPQPLQEHVSGCLRGQEAAGERGPEVKQEAEPEVRVRGDGCSGPASAGQDAMVVVVAAASKASGPGLKRPKLEVLEEAPQPLGLGGVTVVRVGSQEPEDYELEEGEVRFPGDDDLVLENASDDGGSFSSSDSSLDGDSAGEGSARTELSEDEGAPSGAGAKVPAEGGGRPACQACGIFRTEERHARHASRRLGKAWRCRACEGCRPAEEQPRGPAGNRAGSRLGATRGRTRRNAAAGRASSRLCVLEAGGGRGCGPQEEAGKEGTRAEECVLAKGAKAPVSGRGRRGATAGKGRNRLRAPLSKKSAEASEGKQRRAARAAPGTQKPDGLRKHFCNVCGKGFLQRGHLTEHLATHSRVKPFSCRACGREFLRERELRVHVAMHARYDCQLCGPGAATASAAASAGPEPSARWALRTPRKEAGLEGHLESHL